MTSGALASVFRSSPHRRLIANDCQSRMQPEERRGQAGRDLAVGEQALEHSSFRQPAYHQQNLPRGQNIGHAEGQAVAWFYLQILQHAMLERAWRELGKMHMGHDCSIRLDHGNVSVEAKSQQTNVDWPVLYQPLLDALAFARRVRSEEHTSELQSPC